MTPKIIYIINITSVVSRELRVGPYCKENINLVHRRMFQARSVLKASFLWSNFHGSKNTMHAAGGEGGGG